MLIKVDVSRCIASGACRLAAPQIFGEADDGSVTLKVQNPPAELHEAARPAAAACPAAVITIED